jgi:hypothetical protein
MSNTDENELTSEEEKLILQLNRLGVKKLNFQTYPDGTIDYPDLKDLVQDSKFKKIQHLLANLADKGFLQETGKRAIIICPSCSSHNVSSVYSCTRCESDDVERLDFIEHLHCGYIGERTKYENNFQLMCPNCEMELFFVEPGDEKNTQNRYQIVGTNFACNNCGSKFERPNVTHECQKCNIRFSFKNSNYIKLISYELTQRGLFLSPQYALQEVLDTVKETLKAKGLEIILDGEVSGKSLGTHTFNIVARSDTTLIVGDISIKDDSSGLIALFGKKMDVSPTSTFYIDMSGNFNNSVFGKEQNIASFNGLDEKFNEEFENYLDGIVIEPIEKKNPKDKKRFGIF